MSLLWLALMEALFALAVVSPYVGNEARAVAGVSALGLLALFRGRRTFCLAALCFGASAALRLEPLVEVRDDIPDAAVAAAIEIRSRIDGRRVLAWTRTPTKSPVLLQLSGLPDSLGSGARVLGYLHRSPVVERRNPDDPDRRRQLVARAVRGRGWVESKELRVLTSGRSSRAVRWRMSLVRRWRSRWGELSPLWEALLLGYREGMGRGPQRLLASLGLAHLLALSGLHVGIVTALVMWPLRRWGRRALFYLLLPLLIWAWLAGLSSSLLRAVGMLSWWSMGQRLQRPTRVIDGLAAIALVEMAWRPHALLSVGWWLSYAATAAILRGGSLWRRLPRIVGAICVSIAAQIATLPWTLGSFGSFAIFAAPLLLVIGPVFGFMLSVGLVVVVLQTGGVTIPGSSLVLAFSSHLFGATVAMAARWMPEPWGHPGIHGLAWAMALVAVGLLLPPWRSRARWRAAAACALVLLAHGPPSAKSRATWVSLDVGQGDAAVYRSAGHTLVVDAGPWSRRFDPGEAIVLPYLRRRNLYDVDLVITHGHLDHYGGAPALLASGRVGRIHVARCDRDEEWVRPLAEQASEVGAEMRFISAGDSLRLGNWPVVCLWPPEDLDAKDPNLRSVVLLVGSPEQSLLATGDLERDAEPVILSEYPGSLARVAVLKVAHHGGNTGTDPEWLQTLSPDFALVSCARVNRYGHPHPALLERLELAGIPGFRTDRSGAITVRWPVTGGVRLEVCR